MPTIESASLTRQKTTFRSTTRGGLIKWSIEGEVGNAMARRIQIVVQAEHCLTGKKGS